MVSCSRSSTGVVSLIYRFFPNSYETSVRETGTWQTCKTAVMSRDCLEMVTLWMEVGLLSNLRKNCRNVFLRIFLTKPGYSAPVMSGYAVSSRKRSMSSTPSARTILLGLT